MSITLDCEQGNYISNLKKKQITWICWSALLAEGYDNGIVGSVLPFIKEDKSFILSKYSLALISSSSMLGMLFGGIFFGLLGDKYNKKTIFIICFILFSVAMGTGGMASGVGWLFISRLIGGGAVAGIVPLASTITNMVSEKNKENKTFGLMYSGYVFGIFISTIFVILFGKIISWRYFVWGSFVPLVVLPIYICLLPNFPRGSNNDRQFNLLINKKYINIKSKAGFYLVYIFGMLVAYGLSMWLPIIMRNSGMTKEFSVLFLSIYSLSSALGAVVIGIIADYISPRLVICFGFIFGSIGLIFLGISSSYLSLCISCALAGSGTMAVSILVTSYVASYFGSRTSSSMIGSCISISRLGAMAGPFLSSELIVWGFDKSMQFSTYAVFSLLAAFSILLVSENKT
ncbi:MFS transporter [Acetobacter senegalensis]|uniref:MFS transporter n=1 Tax=Acetobacter senegalensis TaxID=446692 RepID=UPI00128CB0C8|nr:MFS transporter [Acetobacter senegalensis]MPQ73152.1 MFS transporter [Acetobacter senegalensis]